MIMPRADYDPNEAAHDTAPTVAAVPPLIGVSAVSTPRVRVIGAGVCLSCAVLLVVAAILTPNPAGVETHRQLGLAPCGFLVVTRLPCPTCGMTTSFAHMVRGQAVRSFVAQPLGALLSLVVMAAVPLGAWMAITGRTLQIDVYRLSPSSMVVGLAALFFLGWGGKIAIGLLTGTLPWKPD